MRLTIVTGFFLPVPPLKGGSTEKIWHRLAQVLAARGHEVTFVSRQWQGLPDRGVADGVNHIRLPGHDHSPSLVRNLWRDLRWGVQVARVLPPADAVICNTVTLPVWLRRFAPRAGKVVAVVARMPKGHGRAYGGCDLLLSLSPAVTDRLIRENPALAGRVGAFPYPIDWSLHAATAASVRGRREPPLTIGYVGRVHPEKGLDLLIRAGSELAGRTDLATWRLEIVGPHEVGQGGGGDAYRDALLASCAPAFRRQLRFAGPEYDPKRLAERYAQMDVFCYPSVAEAGETFGVAVAEAMAAGAATVVSNLPCFQTLAQPGRTALVFDHRPADAPARLAGALGRLLQDGALRREIGMAAQQHVRQYDFDAVASGLLVQLDRLRGSEPDHPATT